MLRHILAEYTNYPTVAVINRSSEFGIRSKRSTGGKKTPTDVKSKMKSNQSDRPVSLPLLQFKSKQILLESLAMTPAENLNF